jgi:membrane protein
LGSARFWLDAHVVKLLGGGPIAFRELLKRVYAGVDVISDYAAQVAYYFLFSLFPLLFFLTALAPYLPIGDAVNEALAKVRPFLPAQARSLVDERLNVLLTETRPKLLTFGIVVAIWSASRGAAAIGTALNHAYEVKERRPYWKVQLAAVGVTIAGALLGLLAISALIAGSSLGGWAAERLGVATVYHVTVQWLRWPVTALVIMLSAAMAYYFLPDVDQRFKFITPGSITATAVWMLATWGFGFYVSHFGSYDATYGSIGGLIVLLTWLYISAAIFLLGGKINAVIEHASDEGKKPGEHSADEHV